MKPTEKQIEEIADNLDLGMRCFYNLKTGELKTLLNTDRWIGEDLETWEEDREQIDENWADYFEFDSFDAYNSFKIMVDFAESIGDLRLHDRLINALNRPKPFRNFKWQIDNSGLFRQKWFDFKKLRYIQFVKEQIDLKEQIFNE